MKIINSEKLVIKSWCNNPEESAINQAKNLANLPFAFKQIVLAPDTHQGYGMPIGGILATEGVVIPNAVGVDIGCGMIAVKTYIKSKDLDNNTLKIIMGEIRKKVPVRFNKHDKMQDLKYMPYEASINSELFSGLPIIKREYDNARLSLGTLGGGNHFIEIQKGDDGYIWIMVHTGSRNLGKQVADHYNNLAKELNKKWYSQVPKEWDLAFLSLDSQEGQNYLKEMNYALEFATCNRHLIIERIKEAFYNVWNTKTSFPLNFMEPIELSHNYARMESHFGKNVMIHRKGATSAKFNELGIIPGSQGSNSYIVIGKGNKNSFMSCSHGAGRKIGRKQAQKNLNLDEEIEKLDKLGVVHNITTEKDLDEASGAYKDISVVMKEQEDLVDIAVELTPMGVIKG